MTHHHHATLETIKMVEKAMKRYSGKYTKYQLWKKLPKQSMYQTYSNVFEYLLQSHKIYLKKNIVYFVNQSDIKRFLIKRHDLK